MQFGVGGAADDTWGAPRSTPLPNAPAGTVSTATASQTSTTTWRGAGLTLGVITDRYHFIGLHPDTSLRSSPLLKIQATTHYDSSISRRSASGRPGSQLPPDGDGISIEVSGSSRRLRSASRTDRCSAM